MSSMEYILFAADSIWPSRRVFEHTVDLCAQMTARLNVLQIIQPRRFQHTLSATRSRLARAHFMFETSMSAATYAQAGCSELARQCLLQGEHALKDLRRLADNQGVHAEFSQQIGPFAHELISFLEQRPDMVMAVLDAKDTLSDKGSKQKIQELLKIIPYKIGIPVIVPGWSKT